MSNDEHDDAQHGARKRTTRSKSTRTAQTTTAAAKPARRAGADQTDTHPTPRGASQGRASDRDAPGRAKECAAFENGGFLPLEPAGLGARGGAFWRWAADVFEFDRQELELLAEACRTMDELDMLAAAVTERGALVGGSTGQPRVNPAMAEARNARLTLSRLLRALDLPEAPTGALTAQERAAQTASEDRSSRARAAANARWAQERAQKGRKHG